MIWWTIAYCWWSNTLQKENHKFCTAISLLLNHIESQWTTNTHVKMGQRQTQPWDPPITNETCQGYHQPTNTWCCLTFDQSIPMDTHAVKSLSTNHTRICHWAAMHERITSKNQLENTFEVTWNEQILNLCKVDVLEEYVPENLHQFKTGESLIQIPKEKLRKTV